MNHEEFDPEVYEQLSNEEQLKLGNQITKSLNEEIENLLKPN